MPSRFIVKETPIQNLLLLERKTLTDERGFFERLFCSLDLMELGYPDTPLQTNRSLTRNKGAVRGMHFQYPPHSEWKLVTCLRGRVFDIAVDIRKNSPSFLHYYGVELGEDLNLSLLIPAGFAHGFQTLTENCEMLYFSSPPYAPAAESGIRPEDPAIKIKWPLPITQMSPKDAAHPFISNDWNGLENSFFENGGN